jgi:hypothetical protein
MRIRKLVREVIIAVTKGDLFNLQTTANQGLDPGRRGPLAGGTWVPGASDWLVKVPAISLAQSSSNQGRDVDASSWHWRPAF